jgi:hypothetical protein
MGLFLQHHLRYAEEGEDMLNRIVTEDESWVHHYQPESKRASLQWKQLSSLSTRRIRLRHQLGSLCLPCFEILRE